MFELYWLGADDLKHDNGGPLEIEQPQKITTKPLSPKDEDDRIRMVFGLTRNDPLPAVDDESRGVCRTYLAKNLVFPVSAEHVVKYGAPEQVTVISLGDSDEDSMFDKMYGVLCEARSEGLSVTIPIGLLKNVKDKSNRRLIDDHCH